MNKQTLDLEQIHATLYQWLDLRAATAAFSAAGAALSSPGIPPGGTHVFGRLWGVMPSDEGAIA